MRSDIGHLRPYSSSTGKVAPPASNRLFLFLVENDVWRSDTQAWLRKFNRIGVRAALQVHGGTSHVIRGVTIVCRGSQANDGERRGERYRDRVLTAWGNERKRRRGPLRSQMPPSSITPMSCPHSDGFVSCCSPVPERRVDYHAVRHCPPPACYACRTRVSRRRCGYINDRSHRLKPLHRACCPSSRWFESAPQLLGRDAMQCNGGCAP